MEQRYTRPDPNYQPDIWGDRFLDYTPLDEDTKCELEQEVKQLKEEVRQKISDVFKNPKQRLVLVDAIQRLGVAYHFEEEIEANLQKFQHKCYDDDSYEDDLQFVSLRFRLLRQHGFYTSCDVFEKFKYNGRFKDTLKSDVQGILNLYEASYLRVHGESILDETLTFSMTCLTSLAMELNSTMAEQITHSLKTPLHRRTTRLQSKYYISVYESADPSLDPTLIRFAKLDFNFLQHMHKEELKDITRWSRSLDSIKKLPYVRDRIVEAYIWNLTVFYEPKYSFARTILNKLFKIITIIDDTYDTYGTFEELELFTDAIQRWDKRCMGQLPDYMKFIYQTILDTIDDFEKDLAKEGRSYATFYMQQEIITLCQAYLQEAKWCHENHVPTYDEYMRVAVVSAGYFYLITGSYLGLGEIASEDAFEWIHNNSKAAEGSSVLSRLLNDMGSHKFEQSRGQVASAIECYMTQYNVTMEEACDYLQQQVEEAWKDINKEMLRPTIVPMPLLTPILNLCRSLYDIYQTDEDAYTMNQCLQDKIEEVLINPIML